MNDKKTITVEIPVLDNVDQMKVVETFTEEQLWYVCVIAKAFEKTQSNWNSLREFVTLKEKPKVFGAKNGKTLELAIDLVFDMVLDKMNELEGKDKE